MGEQKRFWNWQDEDSTFDLSRWHLGVLDAGLYRGFDAVMEASMDLKLIQTQTGAVRTNLDRTISQKFGVIITKQGVTIQQDGDVVLSIAPSTAARIDLIVVEHEYKELTGGIDAIYRVIQGGVDGLEPALTNASLQVILGKLSLPENCTALNQSGVAYIKAPTPTLASNMDFVEKVNGTFLTNLSGEGNKIINLGNPTQGQDAATKYYVDLAVATNTPPATESNRGVIEIADAVEAVAETDDVRAMTPYKAKLHLDSRKADQSETNIGTNDAKFITPKTLNNRFATETRTGIARIATQAEIEAGIDDSTIVTPFKLKQFLGLQQYVVELGVWDVVASNQHSLNHTFAWWDKVVASEVIFVTDDQTTRSNSINGATPVVNLSATTIEVSLGTAGGAEYDSTAVNRGYVVFWVKMDIVPPTSFISVNAGADYATSQRLLKWSTPFLDSVKITLLGGGASYPSSLPQLQINVIGGIGFNTGVTRIYAKRTNPVAGNSWNNWTLLGTLPFGSTSLSNIYITDTYGSMDGYYDFKAVTTLEGMDLESNVIQTAFTGASVNTTWGGGTEVHTVTDRVFNLNGQAESIGSPMVSTIWSIISQPAGSNVVIANANTPVTSFITDSFGTYVLRLTATNGNGDVVSDEVTFTINQIINSLPVAAARWSDNNSTVVKNITTNTYDANGGSYFVGLQGSFSYDPDGVVTGYQWQWRKTTGDGLLFGWQDMWVEDITIDNVAAPSALIFATGGLSAIFGSGHYEFKCRVKDNLGGVSDWSNILELNLTVTVNPSALLNLTILSGGSGNFHTTAQLIVSPTSAVHKLVAKTTSYNTYGTTNSNDVYLKVQGGSTVLQWYGAQVGIERDITSAMNGAGGYIQIWQDLNNTPPLKTIMISFIAYDINNNVLATKVLSAGHM